MGGFGEAISARLSSNEAHLIVYFDSNNSDRVGDFDHSKEDGDLNKLNAEEEILKQQQRFLTLANTRERGIESINLFESQDLIIKNTTGFQVVVGKGYPLDVLQKIEGADFDYGNQEMPDAAFNEVTNPQAQQSVKPQAQQQDNQKPTSKQIVVNYELAMQMNLSVGDELIVLPAMALLFPPSMVPPLKKVRVEKITDSIGVQNTQPTMAIFYPEQSLDFGQYSQIQQGAEMRLKDPSNYVAYKNLFQNFNVSTWADRNSTLFFALKLEKFIMVLFIVLAILISCLGISSALFLLMTQKSKDIGIFHAMGLSQTELVKTFTRLGFYLSFIGILFGVFIGVLGSAFFKYNTWNILPAMYQDRTIPAVLDPWSYSLIALGTLAIAWLTCYLPAKHLSQIKPAELLKISRS